MEYDFSAAPRRAATVDRACFDSSRDRNVCRPACSRLCKCQCHTVPFLVSKVERDLAFAESKKTLLSTVFRAMQHWLQADDGAASQAIIFFQCQYARPHCHLTNSGRTSIVYSGGEVTWVMPVNRN